MNRLQLRSLAIVALLMAKGPVTAAPPTDAVAKQIQTGHTIVDLTHAFDEKTIYWPTAKGFKLEKDFVGITEKGYFYSAYRFSAAEHGGTHLDAPIHFFQGRQTNDQIPLRRLIGECVVIDVTEQCAKNRDYQIGVSDLRAWEVKHGRQLIDVIVLLRTDFSKHWPDRQKYLGTDQLGPEAVAKLHFPGLDPQAAKWLVEHRSIKAIGIDTASIDFGQTTHFESHVTLFENNVPALENVTALGKLPSQGATIVALPMKIRGGSGGPARIIAIVPD